jgi:poly(3-hydroxybutyrate) depolymerase
MLLYLHGRGEARFNRDKQPQGIDAVKRHGSPPSRCEQSNWRQPFVVLAPQLPYWRSRWHEPGHRRSVQQIIEQSIADYSVDPERVYVTGFSIGGLGVISLALQTPLRFAAILAVDAYNPEPHWNDREVTNQAAVGTRIATHHRPENGEAEELARMVNQNLIVQLWPGLTHPEVCEAVYRDDNQFDWLRRG